MCVRNCAYICHFTYVLYSYTILYNYTYYIYYIRFQYFYAVLDITHKTHTTYVGLSLCVYVCVDDYYHLSVFLCIIRMKKKENTNNMLQFRGSVHVQSVCVAHTAKIAVEEEQKEEEEEEDVENHICIYSMYI